MTKREWAFLAVGIVVIAIIIIVLVSIKTGGQPSGEALPPKDDAASSTPKTKIVKSRVVPPATSRVSVSINAVPWAEVLIKPPGTNNFIKPETKDFKIRPEPNGKDSNVTPIRGELRVPAGTEIKLIYDGKEETFLYESWKTNKSISHDFLEQ